MTTVEIGIVLLLSLLSFATTFMGVGLALILRDSGKFIATGIGFSAGIMLLISLFDLLPEANAIVGLFDVSTSAALGVIVIWTANVATPHTHLVGEAGAIDPRLVRSVYLIVLGLVLHDLPEGFAMANAYVASPSLGVLVAIAITLHNLPEEFAMAVAAVTLRSTRFLFGAAFLSALAEPVGAVLGLAAVHVQPAFNAYFLAFAAGAMSFVAVHELVPMVRRVGHECAAISGNANHRPGEHRGGGLPDVQHAHRHCG